MATASDIRRRVREYLYGLSPNDRPFETLLNEPLDTSETDIDVTDGNDWAVGDVGQIEETGEQFYVTGVTTNTLTVIRSYGAVAATAATTAGRITKNPRWSQDKIDDAITDTLNELGTLGVHGFATGSITLVASQHRYELGVSDVEDTYGVISVYYVDSNSEVPRALPFRPSVELSTTPAEWAASRSVTILDFGDNAAGDTVYFTYAQDLGYDTDLDTTLAKLVKEQEEIVVLGATLRCMGMTIAPMTNDPGARTDRTVQPGQTSRDVRWYQGQYFVRSRAEAARLAVLRGRIAPGSPRTRRVRRWRS